MEWCRFAWTWVVLRRHTLDTIPCDIQGLGLFAQIVIWPSVYPSSLVFLWTRRNRKLHGKTPRCVPTITDMEHRRPLDIRRFGCHSWSHHRFWSLPFKTAWWCWRKGGKRYDRKGSTDRLQGTRKLEKSVVKEFKIDVEGLTSTLKQHTHSGMQAPTQPTTHPPTHPHTHEDRSAQGAEWSCRGLSKPCRADPRGYLSVCPPPSPQPSVCLSSQLSINISACLPICLVQVQVTLFVPRGKLVSQFESELPLHSLRHHIHTNTSETVT